MAEIRERRAEHLADCVDVLREVRRADRYPMVWPSDPTAWLSPVDGIGAWVAMRGDVLVGHVALVSVGARDAEITRLFTAPAARGGGVARDLLGVAVAHAEQVGRAAVLEVVEDSAAAVALYERLGWRLVGRAPADWTTPEGRRPWSRRYLAPSD